MQVDLLTTYYALIALASLIIPVMAFKHLRLRNSEKQYSDLMAVVEYLNHGFGKAYGKPKAILTVKANQYQYITLTTAEEFIKSHVRDYEQRQGLFEAVGILRKRNPSKVLYASSPRTGELIMHFRFKHWEVEVHLSTGGAHYA